jgi:hypothetical protein
MSPTDLDALSTFHAFSKNNSIVYHLVYDPADNQFKIEAWHKDHGWTVKHCKVLAEGLSSIFYDLSDYLSRPKNIPILHL